MNFFDVFRYLPVTEQFAFLDYFWVQYISGGLFFLVAYVFKAIGLFTIAKRNGYSNKWMAFIPFLSTYYIGVCAQKNKFYRVNAKTLGAIVAIFEFLIVALYVLQEVAFNILRIKGYMSTEVETIYMFSVESYVPGNDVPANLKWATWFYSSSATFIFGIAEMIYFIPKLLLLISFFQTYASRRYILFAIFSALFPMLPIMGILIFVVRKNKAVNYRDFMRAEQARQYQQYQQYRQQNYNPYNQNPYNDNPYNNPHANRGSGADPFDGFGENSNGGNSNSIPPDDPFEDFDK